MCANVDHLSLCPLKRRNLPFYIPKARHASVSVHVYVCWWWWSVGEKDHEAFQPSSETKMRAKKERVRGRRRKQRIENSEL